MVVETDPGAGLESKLNHAVYAYTDNEFQARNKMYQDVPELDQSKMIIRDDPENFSEYTSTEFHKFS